MINLSGYKIIKKIASGGMGDVYFAEHVKLKKKVAIKSLHKNLVENIEFRKRFDNEAQTHSKLDHLNIVRLIDYKEVNDGLFLIMEYVNGMQLDDYINNVSGPIPEQELINLFSQVLDAIAYAHKKGLVHRDIKPSNIMIDKEGRIKVLDFGIAKMQEEDKGLTKSGVQIGTAAYMSPEQIDTKKVDKLTDIYSLGVTLFYMAVGKSPYSGETNAYRIHEKIMREPFPLASDFYPAVSEKLQEIILKATQKKKSDRYQSCNEFLSKLKKITSQRNNNKTETKTIISDNTITSSIRKNLPKIQIIGALLLLLTISILFYFSSGLQYNETNNSEKVIADSSLNVPLKIGDFYEGGVVFFIEKNGDYALVSAINDLGKAKFGCIGFYVSKDSPDSIGSGEKNTNYWANITPSDAYNKINKYNTDRLPQYRVKDQDRYDAEAALLCKKSSNKGYTDWFLPSINELKEMHNNQSLIDSISLLNGGSIFLDQYYWSSSADNLTNDCTEKINFNLEPTAPYQNLYYNEELFDSSRRSGFREQINNVRAIRIVKGFFVEGKFTKEKVSVDTNIKEISLNQKSVNTNAKETSLWRSVGKDKVKIIHDYTDYDGFSDFYQVVEKMNDDEKRKFIKIQYNLIEECIGNCNDGIGTLTTLDSIGYLKKVYDGQFANGELIKGKIYIYTSAPVFFGDDINDYKFWSENKIRVPFWLVESFEGSFSRNPGYGLGKLVEGEWYRSSGKYGGVGLGRYSTNFQELLKGTFDYGLPKKVTRNWKEYIGYNDPKDYFEIGGKSSYFYTLKENYTYENLSFEIDGGFYGLDIVGMNGKGKEIIRNNNEIIFSYHGEYKEGKFHGKGKFKEHDNRFSKDENPKRNINYVGDFENGMISGNGILTYEVKRNDGKIYSYKYEGHFFNDIKSGFGVQTYTNKKGKIVETYSGLWDDGVPSDTYEAPPIR